MTAVIDRTAATVVWRDFSFQNTSEPFEPDYVLEGVGPFVFDRQAYEDALLQYRNRWPGGD